MPSTHAERLAPILQMVTGIGALSEGELQPTETINDEGYFTKYNKDEINGA